MGNIILLDRSIIPACDVSLNVFEEIIRETGNVEGIGGYKVGVSLLDVGLRHIVEFAREYTYKPIIYDHQKAGTDISEATPDQFMDAMVRSRVSAVILFPQAGPITEYEWIKAAQDRELGVIVGGEMTHPRYGEEDLSEGKDKNYSEIFRELGIERPIPGFIRRFAPDDMYEIAARMGVRDFVVPGNKPDKIRGYKALIEDGCGATGSSYYSSGLIAQGGEISEGAEAAGERFHGIVGRALYNAENKREAALELTSKL